MKELVQKFHNFVMNYNDNEGENQVDLLIEWFDTIISMMDIIMVEDYTIIKKLVSFVKLVTTQVGYIDDDMRIEIYHRQIAPLLEDLNSRYEDTSSKTVADVVHGFTETHYSEDVENIFRIHKTIDNIDTNIINSLDNLDVSDEKMLLRCLSSVQDILRTHYMNIVNDEDDVIFIAPLQEIQRCLNNIVCKLDPYSLVKQTVLNLNIICSLLLSVEKGDSKLQYFKPIIDKAFIYTKIGFT